MVVDNFLTYIRAEKRYSEHTAQNYGRDIRRFFADTGISEAEFDPWLVASDDIRKWIVSLSEGRLGPASVNRMTSSLRSFFKWLRKTGAIEHDPFLRIGRQRTPARLPGYITEARMDEVVRDVEQMEGEDFAHQRNALIIVLFYATGIRLAELLDMRLNDFSDDFREVRIRGKGNKERVVPLVEYAAGKVSAYIERIKCENICKSKDNFIFLSSRGKPVSRSGIYRAVRGELTRMGIQGKRSPHVLRHTFATHMLNDGADIREIQEILGHSSLSATQVYTHNSISQLKEAYRGAHPRGGKKKQQC